MLFIVIKTVYTSLTNSDYILLAVVKYMPYNYKDRLNIGKLYYKATLSLIRLNFTLELIKHLTLLFPICVSTFKHHL